MKILNRLADRFTKVQPLPVGIHHLQAKQDEKPYRLHLRLRNDGSGLLILNASTVLHLNPTAAEYAFHFIKGTVPEEVAKQISTRYRINKGLALDDYKDFVNRIHTNKLEEQCQRQKQKVKYTDVSCAGNFINCWLHMM